MKRWFILSAVSDSYDVGHIWIVSFEALHWHDLWWHNSMIDLCILHDYRYVILITFYRYHGYCYILWLCLWSYGRIAQVINSAFSYCSDSDSSCASSAAECLSSVLIWVYLYHVYLHLQGDKPSCLKVIFVKIIYENFSIFFLETLTEKHPQTSAVKAAGAHLY